VDVGDDARRDTGESPADEREGGLLATLHEDGVRPEAAELARDAERQQRVERRAVERARAHGRGERKARVGAVPAGRAPEDAHIQLLVERVELLCERRRER
jgi:hypothetical protein